MLETRDIVWQESQPILLQELAALAAAATSSAVPDSKTSADDCCLKAVSVWPL